MENTPKKGGYQKGHRKVGGRKKGTPNKTTAEKRALTDQLVIYGLERMFDEKEQLEIREVISMTNNLMPYFQGKLAPVVDRSEDGDENEDKGPIEVALDI